MKHYHLFTDLSPTHQKQCLDRIRKHNEFAVRHNEFLRTEKGQLSHSPPYVENVEPCMVEYSPRHKHVVILEPFRITPVDLDSHPSWARYRSDR